MTEVTNVRPPSPAPGSARALATLVLQDTITRGKEDPGFFKCILNDFKASKRLLTQWRKGQYSKAPWRSLALALATALYFVNPFDLVPDVILVIGYIDDATLFALMLASVRSDTSQFLLWEETQAQTLLAEPVEEAIIAPSQQVIEVVACPVS